MCMMKLSDHMLCMFTTRSLFMHYLFALKFKNTVSYIKYLTQFLCRHVPKMFCISATTVSIRGVQVLSLSDPMSDLVRQYDFPVPLRCRKMSDMVFVSFVCLLSEPVQLFSSCSTGFSQQIAQVVLFLFLYFFSFKTVG